MAELQPFHFGPLSLLRISIRCECLPSLCFGNKLDILKLVFIQVPNFLFNNCKAITPSFPLLIINHIKAAV